MNKKRIIILTGSEIRHNYFVNEFLCDDRLEVLMVYCESAEKGLLNKVLTSTNSTDLEKKHVLSRLESEKQYLLTYDEEQIISSDNVTALSKGSINKSNIIEEIIQFEPDILVAYGCSIVKGRLLEEFSGRFINVHLGLSPYYRGGGTNMWPVVNGEPEYIGATFMYIDSGIDTGEIIHQIRADYRSNDTIHDVGNRLIIKMTETYKELVINFDRLVREPQIKAEGKLYCARDFTSEICEELYMKIEDGVFSKKRKNGYPIIIENRMLVS